jgi:hypothetical protein
MKWRNSIVCIIVLIFENRLWLLSISINVNGSDESFPVNHGCSKH